MAMRKIISYVNVKSEYSRVCYVNSLYSLLVYIFINKGVSSTLFIFHRELEGFWRNCTLENIIVLDETRFSRLDNLLYKIGLLNYDLNNYLKNRDFYGHDHLLFSFIFDMKGANIIEDGLSNYDRKRNVITKLRRTFMGKVPETHGFGRNIKAVYLSMINRNIPEDVLERVVVFEKKQVFQFVSNLFFEKVSPLDLNIMAGNILFTQPLSEDGIMSEAKKINLYRHMAKKYDICYVKPHPRETTNYEEKIGVKVLDKNIPSEILGEKFAMSKNKLVTLYSTALYNLKEANESLEIVVLADCCSRAIEEAYK